jgi:hypothetical protein
MDTSAPGTAVPVPALGPCEAEEFVRFCFGRKPVRWPDLYDEMCAVAARRAFRGWSFLDLAEHGICFTLVDLPRLAAIAEQVADERGDVPEVRRLAAATAH